MQNTESVAMGTLCLTREGFAFQQTTDNYFFKEDYYV